VKTAGRLIPDLLNEEERTVLPEKMQMLRDITFSTWPACTQPDPEDETQEPFVADAIISNPVAYGHIHCAEALAIPLVSPMLFVTNLMVCNTLCVVLICDVTSISCSRSLGTQPSHFRTPCLTWASHTAGAARTNSASDWWTNSCG
jgi:hypothetical protein